MTAGQVIVHLVNPWAISPESALGCLSDEEKARSEKFRFRGDATHWMACRASLRQILGQILACQPHEVPLVLTEFGKPVLQQHYNWLHFNLSHCNSLAMIALGVDGPVGVDLEPLDRAADLVGCETTFCHPQEIEELSPEKPGRESQLLRIWTAKEAVLKALGSGLMHPPDVIRILFHLSGASAVSDLPISGIEEQRLHFPRHRSLTGYQAVVSAPASVTSVDFI